MLIQFFSDTFLPPDISQARRNRGGGEGGGGGGMGRLQHTQILAKVDLVPIDNNSKKIKGAKKYKPYKIP